MFNVFRFELKNHYKMMLIWLLVFTIYSLVYIGMFTTFADSADELTALFEGMPEQMMDGLGFDAEQFTSFSGYYAFTLKFLQLFAFIFASILTLNIYLKEHNNKSVEFLFAKPMNRKIIYFQKLLSIITLITIVFILNTIINFCMASMFTSVNFIEFIQLNFLMLATMLMALGVSVLVATFYTKIKHFNSVAAIIAFGFFFISMIGAIVGDEILLQISIYDTFDRNALMIGNFEFTSVLTMLALTVVPYIIGSIIYSKKDVL